MHVCSLSLSPMRKIEEALKEAERTQDDELKNRMLWLQVSMEFNRTKQIQYIFQHLSSKKNSPKFRVIRLNAFWHKWKREALRLDWGFLRDLVDRKSIDLSLEERHEYFNSQRVELAARTFMNRNEIKNPRLCDILNIKPVESIYSFSTPGSNRPGYYNAGYNYIESAALTTLSDVSISSSETEDVNPWDKPLAPAPMSSYVIQQTAPYVPPEERHPEPYPEPTSRPPAGRKSQNEANQAKLLHAPSLDTVRDEDHVSRQVQPQGASSTSHVSGHKRAADEGALDSITVDSDKSRSPVSSPSKPKLQGGEDVAIDGGSDQSDQRSTGKENDDDNPGLIKKVFRYFF